MRKIHPSHRNQYQPWLAQFLESLQREDLSPSTVRGYGYDIGRFLDWWNKANGQQPVLKKLAVLDLVAYRQHLVNVDRLKPTTINRRLEALRRLCRWANHEELMNANVAIDLKPMRTVRNTSPVGLTEPEVHALLREAGESGHGLAERNYALVQLLLQAGLRVSEVAALRLGDVDLRDRSGMVRIRQGKGRKDREVPLNATARRALRQYLAPRHSPKAAEPLFVSSRDAGLPTRTIQAVVSQLARRAKITRVKVSAHTLRHTFALNYLRQNPGKLVELAHLLGHESLDTTAIYTRPSREELAADLERSRLNVYG